MNGNGNGNGHDMLLALGARGAHPDIAGGALLFAPLAGAWDLEVFDLEEDGARRVSSGKWHFGWVLEGRAMQDVIMVPARGERHNGITVRGNRCATSLRIFDPANGAWRVHYFNPVQQTHETLMAKQHGKDIVQTGADGNGAGLRETFSDIAADSFSWRRETADASDGWKLKSEYFAKRRRVMSPPTP